MKVLSMGLPFGTPGEPLDAYQSSRGNEVRTLAIEGPADYTFTPEETTAQVLRRVRENWEPGLLLCWCPEVLPPPLAVEECPIRTAAVVSDWTVYHPQLKSNLRRYDVVITDRKGAGTLQMPGVVPHYIGPIYAHRSGVHRKLDVAKDIDVAFAGNLNHAVHERRGRLLEQVAALSDRHRVVITSDLPADEYTQLLNRTRIAFNGSLRSEMNLRCFEAIACGAVLFVEEDNLEVGDWLSHGEEAVLYREDNLQELLEHYLTNPDELTRIAAKASECAVQLAGEMRLDDFIEGIAALPNQERTLWNLPEELRALAEVMQYASSPAAGQKAYAAQCLENALARFPEDPVFLTAKGALGLEELTQCAQERKGALLQTVLEQFRTAASARPDAAALWLNLAFVSRRAGVAEAEARFLELALDADSLAFAELLLGERRDPYYARYREAEARGTAQVEHLWAGAAARLAVLLAGRGESMRAKEWAQRSIAWWPDMPHPYRTLARVEKEAGRIEEAAALLSQSLPLTALDADHRAELVGLLRDLGRHEGAQALAGESVRIFNAWPAAAHAAERFRQMLD